MMAEPALGLEGVRPIDLSRNGHDAEVVKDPLTRRVLRVFLIAPLVSCASRCAFWSIAFSLECRDSG